MHHIRSGEVVDVARSERWGPEVRTVALVKADTFELIRIVLSAGQKIPEHVIDGPLIVQCLEGVASVGGRGIARRMTPGVLVWLDAFTPYTLTAIGDCTLLLTIVFSADSFSASR